MDPKNRSFSDQQLIDLYGTGISDGDMAKAFGVTSQAVSIRRYKLGLEANFPSCNPQLSLITAEECPKRYKRFCRYQNSLATEKYRKDPEFKKRRDAQNRDYYNGTEKNDPEFMQRKRQRDREFYGRKKHAMN